MGSLFLFILLFAIFSISGVFTIIRKLLGGVLGIFKDGSMGFGGGQSSENFHSNNTSANNGKRNRPSQVNSERMRRFKSMAEDTEYEDTHQERVEMNEQIFEEIKNK